LFSIPFVRSFFVCLFYFLVVNDDATLAREDSFSWKNFQTNGEEEEKKKIIYIQQKISKKKVR